MFHSFFVSLPDGNHPRIMEFIASYQIPISPNFSRNIPVLEIWSIPMMNLPVYPPHIVDDFKPTFMLVKSHMYGNFLGGCHVQ